MKSTVCLNMIVKNERKTLPILFDSVKDIIDYYVIVDTGSSDGTPEFIIKFMDEYGINGQVFYEKWINFGVNRQQALRYAIGTADYAFIIDADEEFNYSNPDFFKTLYKDCYYLKRLYGSVDYYLPGLINIRNDNALGWKWKGPVHNYLVVTGKKTTSSEFVDTKILSIKSNVHGGAKSHNVTQKEKYLRDAKLLLEELERNPNDPRSIFYLAQSYRDASDDQKAIEWYTKRSQLGGWEEEVYFSLYMIAFCKQRSGKYNFETELLYDFLKAFNYRKSRREALFHIVNYYRLTGKHKEAFAYGMLGFNSIPTKDILFVNRSVRDYRFIDEVAIAAYWCGHYEISFALGKQILEEKQFPEKELARLTKNFEYTVNKLEEEKISVIQKSEKSFDI